MLKVFVSVIVTTLLLTACNQRKHQLFVLSAPAGAEYTTINKSGFTVIPNGRLLTPAGISVGVAPHPCGLAVSDDGDVAVTANSGIRPLSISIIKGLQS